MAIRFVPAQAVFGAFYRSECRGACKLAARKSVAVAYFARIGVSVAAEISAAAFAGACVVTVAERIAVSDSACETAVDQLAGFISAVAFFAFFFGFVAAACFDFGADRKDFVADARIS